MPISEGKLKRLTVLSDRRGLVAAAAMDQRDSLRKALASARGVDVHAIDPTSIREFKTAVARALTPHASAILLDPEFGLEAARARGPHCGLILAYERSGYDHTRPGRLPHLIPGVSARRLMESGADAIKILLYYSPFEDAAINLIKHAFVEHAGAECASLDVPFFLELLAYDVKGGDSRSVEFARQKPEIVRRSAEEFSKDRYGVDMLKVEVPVNTKFVEGSAAYQGEKAYSRAEALRHFRMAADAAAKPFIYLSAGVSNTVFVESLQMAAEAGAGYCGVLCGRATWKDGIPVYVNHGLPAFEDWLASEGVSNIQTINNAISSARPWSTTLAALSPP